jgi:hypothetical protein
MSLYRWFAAIRVVLVQSRQVADLSNVLSNACRWYCRRAVPCAWHYPSWHVQTVFAVAVADLLTHPAHLPLMRLLPILRRSTSSHG